MNIFISCLRYFLSAELEWERCHKAVVELIKDLGDVSSMLDVGCGNGDWTIRYATVIGLVPSQVNGIECKSVHLEKARNLFSVHMLDIEKDSFPFETGTFDMVICNQVLEHLKNVFFVLGEMDRVLRTGGYLVIGIPNLSGWANRWRVLIGRSPMCHEFPGPHCRAFTHGDFLKFLKTNANFKMIKCLGSSFYPFPPPLLEILGRFFPGGAAYTYYLFKKVVHNQPSTWLAPLAKGMDTNF